MKIFHILFILMLTALVFWGTQQQMEKARQEAIIEASERLKLTRDIRIAQLNSELKTIYSEIRFWADSKVLTKGMQKMLVAWHELSADPKARARQLYIMDNPLSPNYAADYNKANDGSLYSENHEILHYLLKGLTKRRGYYDVFLIANNGDIIYTVFKEDDFATNLLHGKYKDTTLAQGFREVQDDTDLNHVSLFDYIAYAPSNNVPSSFILTSVIDENNKTLGVLAFQLPVEPINAIISNISTRLGLIEVLAVGEDHLLRNRVNKVVVKTQIKTEAIDKALRGESGVEQLIDNKGKLTLTAYAPFEFSQNILGKTKKNMWAILVKKDMVEILTPVDNKIKKWLSILAGLTFLSLLLAWLFVVRSKQDLRVTDKDSQVTRKKG